MTMMAGSGIGSINLKVLLMDTDFYTRQAVNSYLAWDRRTRVIFLASSPDQMWAYIANAPQAEYPDVILMDADHFGNPENLRDSIKRLQDRVDGVLVVCLAQFMNPALVEAAAIAGARAYLLKEEVRLQIAWAICFTLDHDFVVTALVAQQCAHLTQPRIRRAVVLPEQRSYPELTDRIRQAVLLSVVEGMPAHLAADEMGISLHTIRGYIKEGYRILESYDAAEYPVDMTPQERAFMRLTALARDDDHDTFQDKPVR